MLAFTSTKRLKIKLPQGHAMGIRHAMHAAIAANVNFVKLVVLAVNALKRKKLIRNKHPRPYLLNVKR